MRVNLKIVFLIGFVCILFGPLCFSRLHFLYFAPFLVASFYKRSRYTVLWYAIGCGVINDLFSSNPYFGLTAINFSLTSLLLYGQTRNFFADKLSTLPIMSTLFSLLSTSISAFMSLFFGQSFPITLRWILTDIIGMSLFDGVYALFLFSLPFQLTYKLSRMRILKK